MTAPLFTATSGGRFSGAGLVCRCALGRTGVVSAGQKREGDGASPAGTWTMRRVFYRADRLARPQTGLACIPLHVRDGWCDDPEHRLYNRPVSLPFAASHEELWREDQVYDVIVELGYNDAPVVPGHGSAIFLHLARDDYRGTQGCIALSAEDMVSVLARCQPGSALEICF